MAQSGIPPIDDLLNGTGGPIAAGLDPAAVGAVQDLLRGHGFTRMPGPRDRGRGSFGPLTRRATADFRAGHGLPPGEVVDRPTLRALLDVPAIAPLASRAYVTLVLDVPFDSLVKLVSLVSLVAGGGRFAAINPNTDRAGLSFGIIQWAQKPKRVHELLAAFDAAQPTLTRQVFAGTSGTDGFDELLAYTDLLRGGVNTNGTQTDPVAFDLIHDPWRARFRAAGRDRTLQVVQVGAAREAFRLSADRIRTDLPKLVSERAVAFGIDLANQFGDAGAKALYDAVEAGVTDEAVLLARLRDASVTKLRALFPTIPQIPQGGADRRNFFITTGLLADTPFVLPGGTTPPDPPGPSLQRYFLPQDQDLGLDPPITGASATPLIMGDVTLPRMRADIAAAVGPNDFVYLLNWHCDVDLELVTGTPASTLRNLLTAAAAGGAEVRAMFWGAQGVTVPVWPPVFIGAPQRRVNTVAQNMINGLTAAGGDGLALFDTRFRPIGSHHQKVLVIGTGVGTAAQALVAYVGGIDYNIDRLPPPTTAGSPQFDVHVRLEGAGAWLALNTFVRRWNRHPEVPLDPLRGAGLPMPPPGGGPLGIQMTHTYGTGFPFPVPVTTAAAGRANGVRRARRFFYMEDQYYVGTPELGRAIRDALTANEQAVGVVVMTPHEISDLRDIRFRRQQFLQPLTAAFPGRFLVFERIGTGGVPAGATGYVHSKVLIVDDEAAFIGSVNSSRRSWSHDSEVDALLVDLQHGPGGTASGQRGWVRDFRCDLWNKHLPTACTGDPAADLKQWRDIAATAPGTVTGSVRPYDVNAPVQRELLDGVWDTAIDPA